MLEICLNIKWSHPKSQVTKKKKKYITLVLFPMNYWDFTAAGGAVKLCLPVYTSKKYSSDKVNVLKKLIKARLFRGHWQLLEEGWMRNWILPSYPSIPSRAALGKLQLWSENVVVTNLTHWWNLEPLIHNGTSRYSVFLMTHSMIYNSITSEVSLPKHSNRIKLSQRFSLIKRGI